MLITLFLITLLLIVEYASVTAPGPFPWWTREKLWKRIRVFFWSLFPTGTIFRANDNTRSTWTRRAILKCVCAMGVLGIKIKRERAREWCRRPHHRRLHPLFVSYRAVSTYFVLPRRIVRFSKFSPLSREATRGRSPG